MFLNILANDAVDSIDYGSTVERSINPNSHIDGGDLNEFSEK